jgi:hypothetical protein
MTLAHAIEDAGIERAKAERVASAIVDLIHDEVATKADVAAVKADVAALSADLRRTEISLKADIPAVRGELKADAAAVRADLALVEHRLLTAPRRPDRRRGRRPVCRAALLAATLTGYGN